MNADGRHAFVQAVRRLLDATVTTRATDDTFRELVTTLDAITAKLDAQPGQDPWFWNTLRTAEAGKRCSLGQAWVSYHPLAPEVQFEHTDDEVVGIVTAGSALGGPPGAVHGGIVALLFDQSMATYLTGIQRPSLTLRLTIEFLGMTPLHTPLRVRAGHRGMDGRKTEMWAEISADQRVTARANGLFLALPNPDDPP